MSVETADMVGYLAVNKYNVDEGKPHIELLSSHSPEAFLTLVRVCPAGLYRVDDNGTESFDYAGCLECGTCRIAGSTTVSWRFPGPTMGVEYRFG